MSKLIPTVLFALAAAGLWAPTGAHAEFEFVSRIKPWQVVAEPAEPTESARPALDFLSRMLPRDADAMQRGREPSLVSRFEFDDQRDDRRAVALNFGRVTPPPTRLRGDTDLFLWSLLRIVQAQRDGREFELVERGTEFVKANHAEQPSAVPLPGALWLFVMGLLGLAGTRLTGKRDEKTQAARPKSSLPMGSPLPA